MEFLQLWFLKQLPTINSVHRQNKQQSQCQTGASTSVMDISGVHVHKKQNERVGIPTS